MGHNRPHPPEHLRRIQELTDAGLSASQIAAKVNSEFRSSYTRHAIVGLWHRGRVKRGNVVVVLAKLPPPANNRKPAKRLCRPEPVPVEIEHDEDIGASVDDSDIPIEQRKKLIELSPFNCHWPVGDVGAPDFFFCGAPVPLGESYCAAHRKRAFVIRRNLTDEERERRRLFVLRIARERGAIRRV